MMTSLRSTFNRGFDARVAEGVRDRIRTTAGCGIPFPLSASPIFIEWDLADRLCGAVARFFDVIRAPEYHREARAWVPDAYRVAAPAAPVPEFSAWDFAICRTPEGELRPYLLEAQGFSSLIGVVPWFGHLLSLETMPETTPWLSHEGWEDYAEDLKRALAGAVLVDVDVETQRLRTDFGILHHFTGVEIADLTWETVGQLERTPRRLYSRVVPVEAERGGRSEMLCALYRQTREWAWSPDWFFMLSKRSLPRLQEVSDLVPPTVHLTAETAAQWRDRPDVVLKPTDDFGGRGVVLWPTRREVDRALADDRAHVLQERVELARVVSPPDGPSLFCDLRLLYLGERPVAVFGRLARDRLCNIAYNGHFPWCGITVGLLPAEGRPAELTRAGGGGR